MKERLNLTIDGGLLEAMKAYAAGKGMSVSELVESYFRQVTRPVQRQSILDMVDQLVGPENELSASSGGQNGKIEDEGVLHVGGKEVKHGL
jgi:hypothetical protein